VSIAAVLYAAGRGERLRPLTDEVAKPALPMLDVPLAAFGLAPLLAIAPTVVMNVRHLPRSVTGALLPYVPRDGRFQTLYEDPEAYGTAGTLACRPRTRPRRPRDDRRARGATVERAIVWPGENVSAETSVRDAIWFGGRAIPVAMPSPRPPSDSSDEVRKET
jgi:hypothetical protein